MKLEKNPLVKKGMETIIQQKEREYLPFRLIEKTKDLLKINPSTPDGWIKKYNVLKSKSPIHHNLSYCLERFLLIDPFNAQIWYKLSEEYGIYLDKRYKNASITYMKTAKSINPNVEKERY